MDPISLLIVYPLVLWFGLAVIFLADHYSGGPRERREFQRRYAYWWAF